MTTWLLNHGADPNKRCDIDNTPLSYAVRYADISTIDLLLRRGGDVRIGQLVHNAIYRESDTLKVVKFLIDRGAPLNSLMYEGHQYSRNMFPFMKETPLHTAVALKRGDVIRYLIHKGASVEIEDCSGQTVIQSADRDTRRVVMQEIQKGTGTLHASL
jgi:ankyrin repeat protein